MRKETLPAEESSKTKTPPPKKKIKKKKESSNLEIKTPQELAEIAISNGLGGKKNDIINFITHHNYYTFGLYAYKFKQKYHKANSSDKYCEGISLQDIKESYLFDQELSNCISFHLGILENSFKALVVNKFMHSSKTYWPHLTESFFSAELYFYSDIVTLFDKIKNDRQAGAHHVKELYKNEINNKDNKYPIHSINLSANLSTNLKRKLEQNPKVKQANEQELDKITKITKDEKWCEILKKYELARYLVFSPLSLLATYMDFKQVLSLYKGIKNKKCREDIADIYGLESKELEKLIQLMIHLRNRCAHPTKNYSAKDFGSSKVISPKFKKTIEYSLYEDKSVFLHLAILQYFLKKIAPEGNTFQKDLKDILDKYSESEFLKYELDESDIDKKPIKKFTNPSHALPFVMGVKDPSNIWESELWKKG